MLFAQRLLLPCSYNTRFSPGATHVLWVSSPQAPAARAGRRLRPRQRGDDTHSVTGAGWPQDSRPRHLCWDDRERENLPLHWGCSTGPRGARQAAGRGRLSRKAREGSQGATRDPVTRAPGPRQDGEPTGLLDASTGHFPFSLQPA